MCVCVYVCVCVCVVCVCVSKSRRHTVGLKDSGAVLISSTH